MLKTYQFKTHCKGDKGEIIISLPTSDRTNLPPPHTGLTRVEDITALGVTFTKPYPLNLTSSKWQTRQQRVCMR